MFGSAVAGIGDVDGDGWPDLAVGAMMDQDVGLSAIGSLTVLLMQPNFTHPGSKALC
jgi:hypothetical protein